MKILMILGGEYPTDNRVEKEIQSLVGDGHCVHLACFTRTNRLLQEDFNGYKVFRKKISPLMYKLSAVILILPFYNWFWKRFVKKLFKQYSYDAIHVHDLPLAKVGYFFKMKYNVLLICDQHEYYSNWIVHTSLYNKGIGFLIKLLSRWKTYEQKYLNKAHLVITVEEPLRKCYIENVKVSPQKLILTPNTPNLNVFNKENVKAEIVDKYKNDWVIFYAGGIDSLRGLDMVIEALPKIKKSIPNIKFVIAGKEAKGFNLNRLVNSVGVSDCVEFIGWIDHELIPSYIFVAKLGVFTPPGNREEIHNTIATKIYQYAAMQTPMIVSNVKLMKHFVEEHRIGMAVDNAEKLADAVQLLYSNQTYYSEMCNNCLKVRKKYNWDYTIKPLLAFYNKLD